MGDLNEFPILLPVGVVKTDSKRALEGRYSDSLNMRFVNRFAQKIGGWVKAFVTGTLGQPRTLHAWRDRSFNAFLAVGTYIKLYVYDQNLVQNDITPFRATGTLGTNPLTVFIGSNVVQVNQTAHGVSVGDLIIIAGATAVGGITPNVSEVPVNTVIDSNNYTYLFTSNATSNATGGGSAVTFKYEIPVGVEVGTFGYGWGVGGYGLGTYGTARSNSTVVIEPRIWSEDHFGTLLIAAYNGGTLYQFDPTQNQPWPRATLLSSDPGMPTNCRAMFVTPERYIFALADGMQVFWCDQGNPGTWTPAVGNTANIRTLTEGTKLVTGRVLADFVSLVWTDAALYRFQYTGATYIYASSMVAKDCGALSPNGCITAGGIGYWIGQTNLWTYNGSVTPMANVEDVRKWIFDQLDINMGYQCNATYSPTFNEVFFFFTPLGQVTPTFGVIYSIDQQCWAPLYWGRCGGTHYTQGDTRPYFGAADTFIYQHENTNDQNGVALPWSLTAAPYAMTKGGRYNMIVEYIVQDYKDQTGDITWTISTYDRLTDSNPLEVQNLIMPQAPDAGTIDSGVSGRYIGVVQSCSSLGSYVRMGVPVAFLRRIGDMS